MLPNCSLANVNRRVTASIAMWGLIFFVGLVGAIWLIDFPRVSGEATVYVANCAEATPRNKECKRWASLYPPITFKPLADRGAVVVQTPGHAPAELRSCAIRNVVNWRCEQGTGMAKL